MGKKISTYLTGKLIKYNLKLHIPVKGCLLCSQNSTSNLCNSLTEQANLWDKILNQLFFLFLLYFKYIPAAVYSMLMIQMKY